MNLNQFKSTLNKLFHYFSFDPRFLFFSSLIVFGLYAQTFWHDFVSFDDDAYIYENLWLSFGLNWDSFVWAWQSNVVGHWHPLTMLSHLIDVTLYGMNAGGHHFTAVIIHFSNTLLVERLARYFLKNRFHSAWIALVFAIHPTQVEVVAWASQRKTLLTLFFGLSATLTYLNYRAKKHEKKLWLWTVILFSLGILSKTFIVTFPVFWLLIDRYYLRRKEPWWNLIYEKRPIWVVILLGVISIFYAHYHGGALEVLSENSTYQNVANALISYWRYTIHWLLPIKLGIHYWHPLNWPFLILALAVSGLIWTCIKLYKHRYDSLQSDFHLGMMFGTSWFLLTMVPVIGFVQVGLQGMADRYLYGSAIGLSFILLSLVNRFFTPILAKRILVVALILWSARAFTQIRVWQDSFTMYENAIKVDPHNPLMRNNYGVLLNKSERFNEARIHFEKAVELDPNYAEAWSNLGVNYYKTDEKEKALGIYLNKKDLKKHYVAPHINAAGVYIDWKQYDRALEMYLEGVHRSPENPKVNSGAGDMYAMLSKCAEAIPYFEKGLENDPRQDRSRYNYAHCLYRLGQKEKGIEEYKIAIHRSPELSKIFGTIKREVFNGQADLGVENSVLPQNADLPENSLVITN